MDIIKGFLAPERLCPLKGRVLMEALFAEKKGELFLSSVNEKRYTSLARVVAGGEEEGLEQGQLVILEDNTEEYFGNYYDTFVITLKDGKLEVRIVADIEAEPLLRERMREYRANPSTHDKKMSAEDLNTGEWWTFNCSDVADWGIEQLANRDFRFEEVPTFMILLWNEKVMKYSLYYIAPISSILAILHQETKS